MFNDFYLFLEDIFYRSVSLYVNPCDDFFGFACNRTYTASKDYEDFSTDPDQVTDDLRSKIYYWSSARILILLPLNQNFFSQIY